LCLIVFDNLESVDAIRDYLPDPAANPHILVISRREQMEFADVELDLLDKEQSYSILVQETGKASENSEALEMRRELLGEGHLQGIP